MSDSKRQVRVQVLLDTADKAEAEMLTERYFGMQLSMFLRLVTKLLINERLDMAMEMKAKPKREVF